MITTTPLCRSNQAARSPLPETGHSGEVLLRSACVVEYTVTPHPSEEPPDAREGTESPDDVLLTVYVRRCLLNPTQVRIIEV